MVDPRTKVQIRGRVVAGWSESADAVIELEDGRTVSAVGGRSFAHALQPGEPALVYLNVEGVVLGWLLPRLNAGVNDSLGAAD